MAKSSTFQNQVYKLPCPHNLWKDASIWLLNWDEYIRTVFESRCKMPRFNNKDDFCVWITQLINYLTIIVIYATRGKNDFFRWGVRVVQSCSSGMLFTYLFHIHRPFSHRAITHLSPLVIYTTLCAEKTLFNTRSYRQFLLFLT